MRIDSTEPAVWLFVPNEPPQSGTMVGMGTSSTVFVFDTNILLGAPDLADVPWRRTFLVAKFGPLRVVVPEVVVQEFGRRRWADARTTARDGASLWGQALKKLSDAKISLPAGLPNVKELRTAANVRSAQDFAKDLRDRLIDEGTEIAAISSTLDHATLVEWSLESILRSIRRTRDIEML